MENRLYYTPPEQALFDELKEKCIEIWQTYDDTYNYATNKIDQLKGLHNISGNFVDMFAMFDIGNQEILAEKLSEECSTAIKDRLLSVGTDPKYIVFK
jgi:hypothetical protein